MEVLIQSTYVMLARYDQNMARAYRDQPFNRISLAFAFLAACKPETPAAEAGSLAVQVAYLDRDKRELEALEAALEA
jgi:hypothetical protein